MPLPVPAGAVPTPESPERTAAADGLWAELRKTHSAADAFLLHDDVTAIHFTDDELVEVADLMFEFAANQPAGKH